MLASLTKRVLCCALLTVVLSAIAYIGGVGTQDRGMHLVLVSHAVSGTSPAETLCFKARVSTPGVCYDKKETQELADKTYTPNKVLKSVNEHYFGPGARQAVREGKCARATLDVGMKTDTYKCPD